MKNKNKVERERPQPPKGYTAVQLSIQIKANAKDVNLFDHSVSFCFLKIF
jgi:hypothetical protein